MFVTYTDTQHEECLGAPVFVLDIDIQVQSPQRTTRFHCIFRWYNDKPLVLLIPSITACVINIVCIVIVASILGGSTTRNATQKESTSIFCVSRTTLASHVPDANLQDMLGDMCPSVHKGDNECCVDSTVAVERLLEILLNSKGSATWKDLKSMDPENFIFSKASAHKAYIRTDFAQKLSDKHLLSDTFPVFLKNKNCSLGMDPYRHNHVLLEHNRDVTVTKEGFEITVPGWYYVYTSVLFKPDTGRPCNDYEYQTWGHWVKLTRPGMFQDEMVLSTYHTCGNNTSRNKDTTFTGRMMYLEAGDKLHAEVSGYGLISYQAYSNFMGLYLIHGEHDAE